MPRPAPNRPLTQRDHALIKALREAVEEGVPVAEAAVIADTRFLRRVFSRIREHGFVIGEQHERYFIVIDPERTVSNSPEQLAKPSSPDGRAADLSPASAGVPRKARVLPGDAGLITRASADGSLSAEGRLFELPARKHFEEAA
jgi:hypothetical protein